MKRFFNPGSVAVIGASDKKGKVGRILVENIRQNNKLKLFPVNPKRKKVAGIKYYSTILDINENIDLAIIATPARFVLPIVRQCAQRKKPIKNIIIISAGFAESGEEGKKMEMELQALAKEKHLLIIGPNCLGVINSRDKINLSFAKSNFPMGKIGLIMQSGAITAALLDRAEEEGLGFSLIATLGNKAVLNENDFIKYYLEDKKTEIIALYLEDIRNGRELKQILKKINGKKPLVVIKAGRSERTKQAIQSHTGAMAGEAEVLKAILKENNAYYVEGIQEFFELLKVISIFPVPSSSQLAIITNAGGPGVIATDLIEEAKNINVAKLKKTTIAKLERVLPPETSTANPIDILGDALENRYQTVFDIIIQDKSIGGILVLITPQAQTPLEKIAVVLAQANKKYTIPVYPIFISASNKEIKRIFKKYKLTHFVYPEEVIVALENLFSNKSLGSLTKHQSFEKIISANDFKKIDKIKNTATREHRQVLFYKEAVSLGNIYGINSLKAIYLSNLSDISLIKKFPVAAKIDSQAILHKKASGGVVLKIEDKIKLGKIFEQMHKKFPTDLILTQPMVERGVELIMGIKNDREFGPVLLLGLGGVATEIFNQKIIFSLPVEKKAIEKRLINSLIARYLIKEKIDLQQVIEEAYKLAVLGFQNKWVKELDLNPIIFYENKAPLAIDIKVLIK